ncbi:MAG TPA: PD-(D/E)XK nuclease family protein, partial [bacterium]|nr:PD-(D/E)XK nuclease family protein [bacterium]
ALGAAAARLIFSFPRLDAATGQVRVASHYLLRVAEALTGRPARYETLGTLTDRISLGRVAGDGEPLGPAGWDLARVSRAVAVRDPQLLRGLPGLPALVRGTRAEDRRWGRRTFTEYDGLLDAAVPPPPTLAATQLETYGLCPFKFFGERILGVREIEEPEAVETITPLDRGALLHDILDRFFSQLVRDGLVPVRAEGLDECRRRLRTIADEVCAAFEKSGAVGYRFMWEVERARILTDLEGVLSFELAEPPGFVPAYFEARFGPTPAWVTPPPGSMPRPLELPVDGRPMRFTGFIDRIDLDQRGAARVIDYKTGMVYGEKSDQFRGGQSLQLPLYIRAADAMLAHHGIAARTSDAFYYYATGKGGYKRVGFSRQTLETRSGEFTVILKTIADGIAAGVFPQRPGKNGDHCRYCSFQPVCGHGRVRLVERKQRDPAIAALTAMWEIE